MPETTLERRRLPYAADTLAEVLQYYETRARQFLYEGVRWSGAVRWASGFEGKACETQFWIADRPQERYSSFYVLASARGQKIVSQLCQRAPILTTRSCNIQSILAARGAEFKLVGAILDSVEYQLIQDFYGDQVARRSQVFLMNHIDEGLGVMRAVGASDRALRAFCLHPLVQNDADLTANFQSVINALAAVPDGHVTLAYAMEYRSVANEYLAKDAMRTGGIRLSALPPVNHMLIGDKVQNRKDYAIYHEATHENRERLTKYFKEWCARLGVDEAHYAELVQAISLPPATLAV